MTNRHGRIAASGDRAFAASPSGQSSLSRPSGLQSHCAKKTDYEAWRPALIAFLEHDSPWMAMTLSDLRKGFPLTDDNRRMIEALILAGERVAA